MNFIRASRLCPLLWQAFVPILFICRTAVAAQGDALPAALAQADFGAMSFEQLASISVTSVSKNPEPLSSAAASVFVITQDDIRRSGAASLPEVLRLAPNLQVAQVSAHGYAISARGFNSSSANKLLVLIDGRSVYTPLFSGVFWDAQDVLLEDVDRIEVISGPAGTLWGVNAVNGVINIITRNAADTQGGLIAADGSNRGGDGAARYGGALGDTGHYRVYAKYDEQGHTTTGHGHPVDDAWHRGQTGFRADWDTAGDQVTVQGNAYRGEEDQPAPGMITISGVKLPLDPVPISGVNLSSRWAHALDGGGNLAMQAYYDGSKRTDPGIFAESLDIVDLQFQHALAPLGRHQLTWGTEYRYGMDSVTNSRYLAFLPSDVNQIWASLYAQDEISLNDTLKLTLGARNERNIYTGNEFLPNVRLGWTLAPNQFVWTAASRTVRAPSRLDRDVYIPGTAPFLLDGGPEVVSETANVYELGYRGGPFAKLNYSITAYHADYNHLRTEQLTPSQTQVVFSSEMEGSTNGIEMWGTYQASDRWRLSAGLTALRERLRLKPGSSAVATLSSGPDPAQTWRLRSSFDLPRQVELDVTERHVSALANPAVPAYYATDVNLGWQPRHNWQLALTALNLFGQGHAEFTDPRTRSEIGREVRLKSVWRF